MNVFHVFLSLEDREGNPKSGLSVICFFFFKRFFSTGGQNKAVFSNSQAQQTDPVHTHVNDGSQIGQTHIDVEKIAGCESWSL